MRNRYIDFKIETSDSFIDIRRSYQETIMFFALRNVETGLLTFNYRPPECDQAQSIDEESIISYLAPVLTVTPNKKSKFIESRNEVFSDVKRYLYRVKKISVFELEKFIIDNYGLGSDLAKVYVKGWLAIQELRFVKNDNSRTIVRLNHRIDKEQKEIEFYSMLSRELHSKSQRIELLLSHGPTKGSFRENLFISLIKKYLPSKFGVSSGFIYGKPYQIDIIVYDQLHYTPYFNEDNIVVIDYSAVRAIIEVKSTLSKKTLFEALTHINSVYNGIHQLPIFKGVLCYKTLIKNEKTLLDHVKKYYNSKLEIDYNISMDDYEDEVRFMKKIKTTSIKAPFEIIDSICVLDQFYIEGTIIQSDLDHKTFNPPGLYYYDDYKYENLSTVLFIRNLFSFLDIGVYEKKVNNQMPSDMIWRKKLENSITIHDDWIPSSFYRQGIEVHPNVENFNKLSKHFDEWKEGKLGNDAFTSIIDQLFE